jgi:hypothetical protein
MKYVPLVFMTLASLAVTYLHGDIPTADGTKPIPELAFVTYVADPGQERAAGMLIDSIRTWGGEYRNALIWVVLTDPEHAPGTGLAGKNVELLPQRLDAFLRDQQFQRSACADPLHRLFLHQAVFTVVLVAQLSREQIHLLPRQYGYPLHLHGKMPVVKKAESLDGLVSVFHESLWQGNPAWMDMLPASTENLKHWLGDEYIARIAKQEQKSFSNENDFPILQGPYLGQKLPGTKPEVFAPGVVSTAAHEFACSFTPDGKEFYFSRRETQQSPTLIMVSKNIDGVWTKPEAAPFNDNSGRVQALSFEPMVTPDGRLLLFSGGERGKGDIYWVSVKISGELRQKARGNGAE